MSVDWITPKWILEELGQFDLDPCSPATMPWTTATTMIQMPQDGYRAPWQGRVWLNPPYNQAAAWLAKMAVHGNGIALVIPRTDKSTFHRDVLRKAHGLLFFQRRLKFCTTDGREAAGALPWPSVLVAYGEENALILEGSNLEGTFVAL